MPDLIALRDRAIALADRKREVAAAVAALEAVTVTIDAAMLRHARSWLEDDEDEAGIEGEPGMVVPLFSEAALYAILGGGDSGDFRPGVFVGNKLGYLHELRKLSAVDDPVTPGGVPSLDGLTRFEVAAIVDAYRRRIGDMTADLRDAGTCTRYMRSNHSRIPDYARGRCLGMFGGSDRDLGFAYTERDFAMHATEFVRTPRADPTDPRGPYESVRVNHHARVFEQRYLAAVVGPEVAARVEAALARIEAATAPRPGEPPVLPYFGSHVTNRIEIAYEPGEIDLDDLEPAAPAP